MKQISVYTLKLVQWSSLRATSCKEAQQIIIIKLISLHKLRYSSMKQLRPSVLTRDKESTCRDFYPCMSHYWLQQGESRLLLGIAVCLFRHGNWLSHRSSCNYWKQELLWWRAAGEFFITSVSSQAKHNCIGGPINLL